MGIRADRRAKRERERLAKEEEQIFPSGKTNLPQELIYKHCVKCVENLEFQISYRKYKDVFKSKCKLKCRSDYEVEKDPFGDSVNICRGKHEIKEDCPWLASMMMEADVEGMYGGVKTSLPKKADI